MSNGGNVDVITEIETGGSDYSRHIESQVATEFRVFRKAVVAEIFHDLGVRDDEKMDTWIDIVDDDKLLEKMPRNSIVARVITKGKDKQSKPTVCYPFFPPYLCFPIKVGEQVWIMSDVDQPGALSYWMCRVQEADYIDDLNYTHADRKWDTVIEKSTAERAEQKGKDDAPLDANDKVPGFPNGALTEDSYSLHSKIEDGDSSLAYEELLTESIGNQSATLEPVPRFTKRPGDMVLQGSNNTLICLGEDRGYGAGKTASGLNADSKAAKWSDASSTDEEKPAPKNERAFCGTIDIVTGRGRALPAKPGGDPELTSCRTITNARKYDEVDKNPAAAETTTEAENRLDHPSEGDPDFMHDASRLYISTKTSADFNFGISNAVPENDKCKFATPFDYEIADVKEAAYIVAKSDEIRIIARNTTQEPMKGAMPPEYPEHNGSIRLIKEGVPDDDMAVVLLLPDGTIQISGSRIFLGRHHEKDGGVQAEDGLSVADDIGDSPSVGAGANADGVPGPGDSQPWIRYEELDNLLTKAFGDMRQFAFELQQTFLENTTPGYGAPNPAILTAAGEECQDLQDNMATRISEIGTIRSKRIFGE